MPSPLGAGNLRAAPRGPTRVAWGVEVGAVSPSARPGTEAARDRRQTVLDHSQLAPYGGSGIDLMPLNRWDYRREEQMGKAPRDRGWLRADYSGFDAKAWHGNVGCRVRPDQLVLDYDPRASGGRDTLAEFCGDHGLDLSRAPTILTGGEQPGRHVWVRVPEGFLASNELEAYPGLEFKGHGRQVVAAGSKHPLTERRYEWLVEPDPLEGMPLLPDNALATIRRPQAVALPGGTGQWSVERLGALLDRLDPEAFADNQSWMELMFACHHATNGEGREAFCEWSRRDVRYANAQLEKRWDSASAGRGGGITARYLAKLAHDMGRPDLIPGTSAQDDFAGVPVEVPPDALPARVGGPRSGAEFLLNARGHAEDNIVNAISAIEASPLLPRWDEIKQVIRFTGDVPWPPEFGRELDDHTERLAREFLCRQHSGHRYIPGRENTHEAVKTVGYRNKVNEVLDYLAACERDWDGVRRVDYLATRYWGCGDGEYEREVSRRFMVSAVRRMRRPGCKVDTMPVLKGPQGWGKSSGVRELFGDGWFSDAQLGDLNGKDAALQLRGIWVQEFAELDAMRRSDVSTLKAFVSRAVDRIREPYGRNVVDTPRRCVFVGTVNEGGYLKDGTGNRRFWPLALERRADLAGLSADRDQLWGEAAAAETAGESHVMREEMWDDAAERQEHETSLDPWEEVFRNALASRATADALGYADEDDELFPTTPPPGDRVLTAELLEWAGVDTSRATRESAHRVRNVMERIGWTYRRTVRVGDRRNTGYVDLRGMDPLTAEHWEARHGDGK